MTNSQMASIYQYTEDMAKSITKVLDNLLNQRMTSEERISLTKADVSATELLAKLSSLKDHYNDKKEDYPSND